MSCHNNIRKMQICSNNTDADYWYRYCGNLIMLNCHDSFCHALNGADKDKHSIVLVKFGELTNVRCA